MIIVRGRIYHNLLDEIIDMLKSFIVALDDEVVIKEFEEKMAQRVGTQYAKTMPFARYALYSILQYKEFPEGSEIIMPPITIKPMVDIVLMLGLKPIFVDIELDTLCFDPIELEKSITENTKAILFTYLFGIVPEMDRLLEICKKKNLYVIEDFSHTINAKYKDKNIGTLGDVSLYSSSSLKTVDTYIGGTVFTNEKKLFDFLEKINTSLPLMPRVFLFKKILLNFVRNLFSKSFIFTFVTNPLLKLLKNLDPTFYKKVLGARLNLKPVEIMPEDWKYKFTSLQAQRGIIQLDNVDNVDKYKRENIILFREYLQDFFQVLPKELENSYNVYWQYPIYIKNTEKFLEYIEKYNIDMGTTNLSLCSYLDIYPSYKKETKNALTVKEHYMFVPTYIGLDRNKMIYISQTIKKYLEENNDKI